MQGEQDKQPYGNGQFTRDVVGGLLVAATLWMGNSLVEIKEFVARVDANRWTASDHARYDIEIQRQLTMLRIKLEGMEKHHDKGSEGS